MTRDQLITALLRASTEEDVEKLITSPNCKHQFAAFETDPETSETGHDDEDADGDELHGAGHDSDYGDDDARCNVGSSADRGSKAH